MTIQKTCPVCRWSPAAVDEHGGYGNVSCPRCGKFSFTALANESLQRLKPQQSALISGWIKENQGVTIKEADFERLCKLRTPTVGEKADKILLWFGGICPHPGKPIVLTSDQHLEMQSVGWVSNLMEAQFLLRDYLTSEKEFLRLNPSGQFQQEFLITPKGWAYLDSLRRENPESSIGFIAMWFDDSMDSALGAIEQGIQAAGYAALRIDRKQHNNKIDDEIVASIRRSKFLVADFTKHRGGVYFEAGFAKGLGLEVFWLCREDHIEELHFDTRQYPHIKWHDNKLPELTKALKDRVEATIGHGPIGQDAQK